MIFLVLALMLVTVDGQARDPTKVCFPDLYQVEMYSLELKKGVTMAYDFKRKVVATRFASESRIVADLSASFAVLVNSTDKTCHKIELDDIAGKVDRQCLPANSTLLTDDASFLGLNPGGLEIEVWEYIYKTIIVRIGVTKSCPALPVIRQHIYPSVFGSGVNLAFNLKTKIDDPDMFTIPNFCRLR